MTIPIIFIHQNNNSSFLPYVLAQARHSNPRSPVVLIGDPSNCYEAFNHELITNYRQSADFFAQVYQHLSTNPYTYELFCFQRWFILKDFMVRNAIEHCLYLDSDVLLYADVIDEYNRLKQFDIALPENVPSCTYINSLYALEQFCEFVIDLYQKPTTRQQLETIFRQKLKQSIRTSISDMDAFEQYRKYYPEKVGDLLIIVDNSTYDARMTSSDGFEMMGEFKQIELIEGQPFGRHLVLNQSIRFNTLHFQGKSKALIKNYFTGTHLSTNITQTDWLPETDSVGGMFLSELVTENPVTENPVTEQIDSPEAWYALGSTYLNSGQPELALQAFQEAVQRSPNSFDAQINLGIAFLQLSQWQQAIAAYQAALAIQPNSALAHGNLAYVYAEQGQSRTASLFGAMSSVLETLTLHPDWAEVHRNLGLVYHSQGRLYEAIACYQQALTLQPNFSEAQHDFQVALQQQQQILHNQRELIQLKSLNFILFPNWQDLEALALELQALLLDLLTHPTSHEIALFVDISSLFESSIDIDQFFEEIWFNLLLNYDLDVSQFPTICPISIFAAEELSALLTNMQARISLTNEDPMLVCQAIVKILPEKLPQSLKN